MRDLRLIGTTDSFPDLSSTHPDDVDALEMRNYQKVVTGSSEDLEITENVWIREGFPTADRRDRPASMRAVKEAAGKIAIQNYAKIEDRLVLTEKLCEEVWSPEALAIVDEVYVKEFRLTHANKHFGNWEHKNWRAAMKKYRAIVRNRLVRHWQ